MDDQSLEALIDKSLADFYRRRSELLNKLELGNFLKRKNPYLLRVLAYEDASAIVERMLQHQLTASDETVFGVPHVEPQFPSGHHCLHPRRVLSRPLLPAGRSPAATPLVPCG